MTQQCPKCGEEPTPTKPFVDNFCFRCYFEQHPLIVLRRPPEAKICSRCFAYYSKGQWVQKGSDPRAAHLHKLVCDILDPLLSPSTPASFEVTLLDVPSGALSNLKEIPVEILAKAESYPYEETQTLLIPVASTLCNQCQKAAGGYFEATLQIRTTSGKLTASQEEAIVAYLTQRLANSDIPPSSLKYTDTRGGFDAKCTSGRLCRSLAKELAEHFGLSLGVSSKVAGRARDGKTLRRETYILRFPPFQVHELISIDEHAHQITGLRNGRYILINLESGTRQSLSPKELGELDAESLDYLIERFQVISVEDDVYQLMSQSDYTLYDFPSPQRQLKLGSIVSAIKWKTRLILLPDSDEENSSLPP